jgi:serine/threonine-protein kinase
MARESYAAALAISPNDLMAQVNIAATYREEEPDLAEIQLKKIIQQHPGSPDAYRSLQYLYYRQGRYVEAVEQLEWVVRLLPDSEPDKSNLTGHLILAGMFDEAKTLLLEMLESGSPELGTIESNLASIQFFQGDYAAAADLYRTAIDREGDEAYLYRNLGDAIWHLDGKKAAEPIFRNAIQLAEGQLEINPDNIDALDTLMVAYGSISDSDRFEILKNRVLELAPNDPQIRYDIAVTASRIEDMESARLHAEKALELGYPVALLRADPDIAVSGASFD